MSESPARQITYHIIAYMSVMDSKFVLRPLPVKVLEITILKGDWF